MVQQRARRHQEPWGAETALKGVLADELFLQNGEFAVLGKPLNRSNLCAFGFNSQNDARCHGFAVQDDGACAAFTFAAGFFCAKQLQVVAQEV